MKLNIFQWSLKTRITLFTLAIFVAGIWSLSFYASRMLERNMQRLLGDQQLSTASYVAAQINGELSERMQYLQSIASSISPAMLRNPAKLQAFLEQEKVIQIMFNGGAFVIQADGAALADVPLSAGRTGVNYKDREYAIAALAEGKTTISSPVMGRKLNAPIISMTTPIKDSAGKVIGALLAVTNLGKPNFLDKITDNTYGKSGGYVLLIPRLRLIVTATDKSRIMQSLPARGAVPTLDRFLDDYEGSAVYVNPLGVEVLGSAKAIPASDWLLGITLPTAEAFAPIHDMQQRVLQATILLTLLAAGLTWWMLRRQLSPLLAAANTMSLLSDSNQPPQPLPITNRDEIGTLIAGFNRLLETLAQREQALLLTTNRLNEAQQFAHIGNWTANMVSGELIWSDEIYRIFGHEPRSFTPSVEAFKAALHPDDVTLVKNSEKQAQQTGHHNVVHRIVRPDGSVRHVHELAHAETDAEGKLVRLSGTVQDITEMRQNELALIATSTRLNEAQHMAHIGNWTLDLLSGELQWSDEVFNLFEIDQQQFGATYEAFLNVIHPDDREGVNHAYSNSLITRMPYEITHRLLMSDGRIKWVQERCTSNFDAAGTPLQSRGMVQDITEMKLAELALIIARNEADRANHAKSEFLSSMSHELRTPMNSILGFGQILDYDAELPDAYRHSVKEILNAGFHLLNLINEVLDLAQIESGHFNLSLESVEVCAVVEECLHLLRVMADKRNIHFSHIGLKGATVRADRTRLKQVLLNLLSNAIKYNRDGGSVRIEIRPQGTDRLRILVTDTGQGIPAARLAEVFQPFNRLGAENSNILGTGIGLTITRRIIEEMGGSVDVESEMGVGSIFWVELPLEFLPAQTQNQQAVAAAITASLQHTASAQYNVLYIEDNPSNLRLVAQILGQRKHIRLITAHTPELGIELALVHHPELILLDINMPDMDGYQVLNLLMGDTHLKDIPVIAVTAAAMLRDIERGMAAGFAEYLTKPLDIIKFFSILDRYLPTQTKSDT